ncbi:hypothetical protein SLEP1_g51363 [Rubroshorea leprosula]|uniref:Uncharacterized protein n=1 Tax=Rubroshorea leprosula TaxID=152421 RepID=A0AAV5M318_9ROSI|nr:hypothetical protein SLEP1_g51363 [Rubroshorea leprosula]
MGCWFDGPSVRLCSFCHINPCRKLKYQISHIYLSKFSGNFRATKIKFQSQLLVFSRLERDGFLMLG